MTQRKEVFMNKRKVILYILVACFTFLSTMFIEAETRDRVKVLSISGKAEYLKAALADWAELRSGIYLYSGDTIRTYDDSSVNIAFERNKRISRL